MKTTNFFRFRVSAGFFLLSEMFVLGQAGRPGIECGCTKYEIYSVPSSKGILVEQGSDLKEGSSASTDPKYTITVDEAIPPNLVTIIIKNKQGKEIFNESNRATGWGFSPDQDRFVMHGMYDGNHWVRLANLDPDPGCEGEQAITWDVISPMKVSSANIRFSPHGKYLLYAAINSEGNLFLRIFNTTDETDDYVYEVNGANLEGSPAGKSVAAWGFSPDTKDATFVHAYLTGQSTYTLSVIRLMATSYEQILYADDQMGTAGFLFSPCGDYFVWIYSSDTGLKGRLYKTNSNNIFIDVADADNYQNFFTDSDKHYIRFKDGTTLSIVDNQSDSDCDDNSAPDWTNATLETGIIKGATMELKWSGASDASGVAGYRIFIDGNLYKEIVADNTLTVTGLKKLTEYKLKIEAGDEAGNWSTNGPEKYFTTRDDTAPVWPVPNIVFKNITETRGTISWDTAQDDYGIEFYRIFEKSGEETVELTSVNGDATEYRIKNLKAGVKYYYLVKAEDGYGQKVSGPLADVTTVPSEDPYWPTGAALKDSAQTETSLVLYWPDAIDNCIAVTGYKICMNGDTIGLAKYYQRDYLVKGLEEGKIYSFEIFAYDESGNLSIPLTADFSSLPAFIVSPLITGPGNQKRPDISRKTVVWWDDSKEEGDIYSYNLETDSVRQVTNETHAQFDPAVSGDRIVWTDTRNGNWDIYMYDPELGEVAVCINPASQDLPAIDGDIIVWRDSRNGDFDIYMYDIKNKTESPVSTHRAQQNWPDVSGNYVVYADNRNGNWDIFMYSIWNKKETSICTNQADQTYPVIDGTQLWNIRIAYMDDRNGKNIYIYYPDFIMGQDYEYLVPLDESPFISNQVYPHLADDQLVFQDLLGGAGTDWNIYAYKFRTETYGKKMEICVDPLISADQTRPRTSKANIVWQDERNGNSDIYIWKRPPGADLHISVKEITDPVVIGDTLRYRVTVLNKGPGMSTSITTICHLPVMAILSGTSANKGEVTVTGNTIMWDIDTLRNDTGADLEIILLTFDLALLDFNASTSSTVFDPDPSNNEISEKTKVKYFIPGLVGEGTFPSMQIEPDGRAHIVYFGNDSSLIYATKTRKGKWEYKTLDKSPGLHENDMTIDANGNIQVAMSDWRNEVIPKSRLYHGTLTNDGHWSKRVITVSDTGFHSISLKYDSHNELYLVYQEACTNTRQGPLKEMHTSGGVWSSPVKFARGYDHVDMEVDRGDNLQTSYYAVNEGLVYQRKNSAGSWNEPEVVEPGWSGGQLEGMVTSIITDDLQNPHISYVGNVNNDHLENIKYAWKTNGIWNISMADKGHFQSAGNEIVIDTAGNANLSYIHFPAGNFYTRDVRYATNIAGPWIKQIIDNNTGALSLDMGGDMDKYTHIVYSGSVNSDYGSSGIRDSVFYSLFPPVDYFLVDPDTLDFGAVQSGSEKTLILKLTNPLTEDIRIDSVLINDKRVSFDRTSFILYRYSTDSIYVRFSQTADPWTNTYLRIWYNVPSDLFIDIPIIAKSWQPELQSDQDPVSFGAIPYGTLATKTVKLKNNGPVDLIISDITVKYELMPGYVIPTDFKLVGHNCTTLQPDQTCDVQISFQPYKTVPQMSYLNIASNDPVTPVKKVRITGETAYPQISCNNNVIDFRFCPMGQSIIKTLTLVNTGELLLNIQGATLSGTDMNQFSFVNACTSIQPGDSCKMQITMTPTKAGDLQATLSVTSNSQYSNPLTIDLKGTSQVRTLELSADHLDFGSVRVGEHKEMILELRNTGSVSINISDVHLSGNDSYEFSQNHEYTSIPAGGSCSVAVTFSPLFEGDKSSSIYISSDDSYNALRTVTLEGEAIPPLELNLSITADPESGSELLTVSFSSHITGGRPPYSYSWEFDDLKSSLEASPVHIFTGPAIYEVKLKVTDLENLVVTETTKIAVSAEGIPVVLAKATPTYGGIPLFVQFDAVVTGGESPLTFLWEFRDGGTSNMLNPSHNYSIPGSYNARITVTDFDGDVSRDSILIKALWNNSLEGQIWDETGINKITKADIVLYPKANINETTYLTINGSNSYLFTGLPAADYTIQAIPDATVYTSELPTYLGEKLALFEATWVNVTGNVTGKDIRLVRKPSPSTGAGNIEGNIVSGSNKGLSVTEKTGDFKGDPIQNAFVFLKGSTDGKLKAYDISGTDGSFCFTGLENSSYYFLADVQGKPMDAANTPLVISDAVKIIEILATVEIDKITVIDITTGTDDVDLSEMKVYPVPAGNHLFIEIPEGLFSGSRIRFRILDLSGRYVFIDDYVEITGSPVVLDINYLKEGIYLLEATDKNLSQRVKIVKMR